MPQYTQTACKMESEITKIKARLEKLYDERARLAGQSYSQSNPGAVMERRDNRRDIERLEKKLEALEKDLKTTPK
jgi:hypothetical protein